MEPPFLAFASSHKSDTLANIRETGEFVVKNLFGRGMVV